jgi:predicted  nucleic acid-binding Zn-ribbon protein
MAQQCPRCGGFDISPETDRFHCLDCGEYFTFDDVEAKDGPAPEPLFTPEERVDEPEVVPEPTDHEALAQDAQTGSEGIDTTPSVEEAPAAPDLTAMTKAEIADHAAAQGIEGVDTSMKKDEMIATVQEATSE